MKFSTVFELKEIKKRGAKNQGRARAKRLSLVLAKRFPYERTYLFGSVLKKGRFTRHSDIDIVIKGLDETLFLKAYAFLLGQSNFPVDLKPWELWSGPIPEIAFAFIPGFVEFVWFISSPFELTKESFQLLILYVLP